MLELELGLSLVITYIWTSRKSLSVKLLCQQILSVCVVCTDNVRLADTNKCSQVLNQINPSILTNQWPKFPLKCNPRSFSVDIYKQTFQGTTLHFWLLHKCHFVCRETQPYCTTFWQTYTSFRRYWNSMYTYFSISYLTFCTS